jgi:hypothetical protein
VGSGNSLVGAITSLEASAAGTKGETRFIDVMRHAIALNGSFFNAQRMMLEYVTKGYVR